MAKIPLYPPPVVERWYESTGEIPPTGYAYPNSSLSSFMQQPHMDAEAHAKRVAEILNERGKTHAEGDDDKERSMDNIVSIFKAVSGVELTIEQGWLFMLALKLGRRRAKPGNIDNYHDAMGYLALLAEHKEKP